MSKAANLRNREKSERTLGSYFVAARQKRGLPIEKAAHETRIRVQRLREIENDDFSHFSHPSYARLFLADYGRYLGIPAEEIKPLLPERGECGSEGYQYLQEVTVAAPTYSYTIPRPPKQRRRLLPTIATASIVVAALFVSYYGYTIVRDLRRIGGHSAVAKTEAVPEAATPAVVVPEKAKIAAVTTPAAAPTEVGVDNAVPAPDNAATDSSADPTTPGLASTEPAKDATTASETPSAAPSPAAASATTSAPANPAVSPEQSVEDHAALLVGGSTDGGGRVQ